VPLTARCWKPLTSFLLVLVADLAGIVPAAALYVLLLSLQVLLTARCFFVVTRASCWKPLTSILLVLVADLSGIVHDYAVGMCCRRAWLFWNAGRNANHIRGQCDQHAPQATTSLQCWVFSATDAGAVDSTHAPHRGVCNNNILTMQLFLCCCCRLCSGYNLSQVPLTARCWKLLTSFQQSLTWQA
jgi:hypothetical protein